MKKISLKNLNLEEVESLSREQLKNVIGGGLHRCTCSGPSGMASPDFYVYTTGHPDTVCNNARGSSTDCIARS